ncbi:MAG: hypothetical protein U0W24_12645 [Bacteroidales bacterium]
MRKLIFIAIMLIIPFFIHAQSLDCPSTLKMRQATPPYAFNDLSKSAQCFSGKKYEFVVPLMKGREYRISFYASPIFNNKITFRIIDQNSGQKVLDLPGETQSSAKGECVLRDYYDDATNKMVHPYFDFYPNSATSLKVIIDIEGEQGQQANATQAITDAKKGCVTIFIQDKKSEEGGF